MSTICTTQAEVDAAAKAGDLIVIDSTWKDSSSAVLRGSSRAVLWGSSSAVLRGSSSAVLLDSSRAELRDSSRAELRDSSRAELRDSSRAVLWDSSRAELRDSSRAELRDSSSAVLWGSSSAVLRGSSSAELWDSSRAVLWGSSSAELWDSSRAVLWGWLTAARLIGALPVATGDGRWMRVQSAEDWCRYHGLPVDDGHVWLTKIVNTDGRSERGAVYLPGEPLPTPDRWDPSPDKACGAGLHLSPSPVHARGYYDPPGGRVMECRVALADIAVHEPDLSKVRVARIVEIREVTS